MRKLIPLIAASLVFGSASALAKPRDGEAELARALEGRVAEAPVDCIDLHRVRNSRVIDGTAILYDAGSVIYVNRPRNGAEDLDRFDTMVTRLPSTRLCSVDVVQMVESGTHMMTGLVFLDEFVPYRRVRD